MRYAIARANAEAKLTAYRIYVTDALMIIGENTAKFAGGNHLTRRYIESISPEDARTGEEIAADVIKRAGLVVTRNEST